MTCCPSSIYKALENKKEKKTIKEIWLQIQDSQHRNSMVVALAHAGYKVRIVVKTIQYTTDYFVVFEYEEVEKDIFFGSGGTVKEAKEINSLEGR